MVDHEDNLTHAREAGMPPPLGVVDFYFSLHTHKADTQSLPGLINNADAVGLEMAGWKKQDKIEYDAISGGNKELYDKYLAIVRRKFGDDSYQEGKLDAIYKSGKPVYFVDISAEDEVFKYLNDAMNKLYDPTVDKQPTFEETLTKLEKVHKRAARLHVKREAIVRENITRVLEELRAQGIQNPNLLVVFGEGHRAIAQESQYPEGVKINVLRETDKALRDPEDLTMLKLQEGQEVTRDEWIRVYVYRMLFHAARQGLFDDINKLSKSGVERQYAFRVMVDQFTPEQAKELHDREKHVQLRILKERIPQLLHLFKDS